MRPFYLIVVSLLVFFFSNLTQSQSVQNAHISFDGKNVIILYDLISNGNNQQFEVAIYSSHNNYNVPLTLVNGDVGEDIVSGTQKKVTWEATKELPSNFNDDLSIKIKARVTSLPNYEISPLSNNAFKRGSELQLNWNGGSTSDKIKIDLLKNNILQQSIVETQNKGSFNWQIPDKQKPGSTYSLRISSVTNPNNKTTTNFFKIKPKIPVWLKVGLPVVIGATVGILVSGGSGGGEGSTTNNESKDLPGPITPGG